MIENDTSVVDKLPTELELTKIFGASRTTIRRALKLLNEEGVLVSRPGMGTFIDRSSFANSQKQLYQKFAHVAYTHETGRTLSFNNLRVKKLFTVADYLTKQKYIVDFVLFSSACQDAVKELKQRKVEYLIWAGAFSSQLETLQKIRDAGIELILYESYPWEGFNVVTTDGFRQGYMAAEFLIKRRRKNLLHIPSNFKEIVYRWKNDGFKKAMSDYGIPKNPASNTIEVKELDKVLYYGGKVDGIFCQNYDEVVDILEKFKVRIPQDCDIIVIDQYSGYPAVVEPIEESGLIAGKKMREIIEKGKHLHFKELLEPKIHIPDSYYS